MLVTNNTLASTLGKIYSQQYIALDTETTGLRPYNGDRLFSIVIAIPKEVFYFDFALPTLSRSSIPDLLSQFKGTIFMHNAKFDMHMCANEGLMLDQFDVHCTEAIGRLVKNDNMRYSLDALTGKKSDVVRDYVLKNKLYTVVDGEKYFHYENVPLDMMQEYAEQDARITLELGLSQIESIKSQYAAIRSNPSLKQGAYNLVTLMEQEKLVTRALFRMERKGVEIDLEYVKTAFEFKKAQAEQAAAEFTKISGIEFKDSAKVLAQAFTAVGDHYPTTDKGNPSFRDEVLETMHSPLAKLLQNYRHARMMANTFLKNILDYRDANNVIHPNFKQAGTVTGRLSCREPNLQNVPKKDDDHSEYPIRNCFKASPGFLWFSIDWKAMEYRLMLDVAGEMPLINAIKGGFDVHQATADMVGLDREQAKCVNFALLYGVGNAKLGRMIGVSEAKAARIRLIYYARLPRVGAFLQSVQKVAQTRKYIINAYGRKLLFNDRNFAYKAPNYLIQGGCGDIMKASLIGIDKLLEGKKSYLFLTVHDEAGIMMHKSELYLLEGIKEIMEGVYQHKHLPMAVDIEYSTTNWGELKEWKNESTICYEG